jgi:pSer/pThr/pTyr-binding forkhead associated (FHA) protein
MGQIFPIAGETTIGRDATNGVPLAMDTTVSRRHAVIAADGGGYIIRDQGSSNGTFVNGQRVEETALRPGDEVSIGGTRFRFEA